MTQPRPTDTPTGSPALAWLYALVCLLAACWAFVLVGEHYAADSSEPGALCGDEGGCSDILSSPAAELLGIPVSVPAIPLFAFLALLGTLVALGRFDRQRLASLATLCGYAGLLFGGRLLFEMIYGQGKLCWLCLTMDGATLASLLLGAALHPGGLGAGLRSPLHALRAMLRPGAEMALVVLVLVATPAIDAATEPGEAVIEAKSQATAPKAPGSTATEAATPASARPGAAKAAAAKASSRDEPPTTRRLVFPAERTEIKVTAGMPTRGPAGAPVTIVLFEDFQCPFCKKLSGNIEMLLEERPKDVRIAFMHFPMHQKCNERELKKSMHKFACGAAAAAVCAQDQGRFWEMHDLLFRNNHRLRARNLQGYAKQLGLDVGRWTKCFKAPETLAKVKADSGVGLAAGVTGTPAMFINGRKLVGAQPLESLLEAVKAEMGGSDERLIMDVETGAERVGEVVGAASSVAMVGPDGRFSIDAFEASLNGGVAESVAGVEPARSVTWYEARDACAAAGKRLCSEAEWLTACTGAVPIDEDRNGVFSTDLIQGRQHVYGEHYRNGICADSRKKSDPRPLITGNHPECRTPEGVYDLEGVTKEWVGLSPDRAALKGGSYFSRESTRCAYYKDGEAPDTRDNSVGFRCCSGQPAEADKAVQRFAGGKVGDTMRHWSGKLSTGATFSTTSIAGKPLVMTFWASWCEPCKKELPALSEIYRDKHGEGLEVIGINVDEDPAAARRYLKQNPLPFPVVMDSKKQIMSQFHTRGVPTTFWVTRGGQIRQRSVGYDDSMKGKVLIWLESLLESR
jgi:protein-disulfide isomerase/thiol-disulfide isomerase/thioredoxin/uncharacterized membrane protein